MTSLTVLTLCMVGLALGQGGLGGAGGGRGRRQGPPLDVFKKSLEDIMSICSDGGDGVTWNQVMDCSKGEKLEKLKAIFESKPLPFPPMLANPNKQIFDSDDKNEDGKVTVEEIMMSMRMN